MKFAEMLNIASNLANHPEATYVFDNEDDFERVRELLFWGYPLHMVAWDWELLSLSVLKQKEYL